jgi:hypothetical protein
VYNDAQITDQVSAAEEVIEAEEKAYLEALYKPVDNLLSIGSS